MTWKTHKNGAFTSTILIYPLILNEISKLGFTQLEYTLLAVIIYMLVYNSAQYGTAWCDLDHGNVQSIPLRNLFTKFINRTLNTIWGKSISHRSWQTHSMDLYIIFVGVPAMYMYNTFLLTNNFILYLGSVMLTGFMMGALIHCFFDMYTTEGVWASIIIAYILSLGKPKGYYKKYRIKLAPTWFWYPKIGFRTTRGNKTLLPRVYKYYPITNTNTGSSYEDAFRGLIIDINRLMVVMTVLVYFKSNILIALNISI